jgi:AraC family transcriptional regulator
MHSPRAVRKVPLSAQPAFDANLIHYAAGHSQDRHEHSRASFSIVLAGALTEEVEGSAHHAGPGQASLKPSGVAHADCYGREGATLLSFVFRCDETAGEAIGRRGWQWRNVGDAAPLLVRAMFRPGPGAPLDDLLWDWLAVEQHAPAGRAPAWLQWAKSELDTRSCAWEIASLAREAGVHRVHFSRQFARYFGLPPSIYRQRQMVARAVRAMIDLDLPAAAAAHDAGFVDQSHMARAIRSTFGTTPNRIAALFAR